MSPAASLPRWRARLPAWPRWAWAAVVAAIVAGILLLILATFDFGMFRKAAERRLSKALHRTVTIGSLDRLDAVSLAPRIRLTDVRIAQPGWAGAGDMVVLREAVVRVPVLSALVGRVHPSLLSVDDASVALVHDAGDRANWRTNDDREHADSTSPDLTTIILRNVRFTLDDRRRKLRLAGTAASDEHGVRIRATGTHRGTPAQMALGGAPVIGGTAGKPWPFRAAFASPLARLRIDARADRPLDFSRFAGTAGASGDDLRHIDDLLLIGLIDTQPIAASARIRRAADRWELTQAKIGIGRSDATGSIIVDRDDGRTRIDARLRSRDFDFDDLDNDAGLAQAAAKQAAIGDRIVPGTRIDLSKLRDIDGRLVFSAAHLLSRTPSIVRSLDATVTLDHATLTVAPMAFGLAHGRLEGRGVVAHPEGQKVPRLTLDLALVGGRLEDVITSGQVAGPLRGKLSLAGSGGTIRSAVAHADGSVALASRGGAVTKSAAELLGRNLGAAFGLLVGGSETRTPLRCFAARFAARGGTLRPSLFTIDTGVMRADGHGLIALDGEAVRLTLDGRSKHPGLVRLPAPIDIRGTLSHPEIETNDAGVASAGTVLKALGQAIGRIFKDREAPVPDVDCGALMARAGV